MKRINTSMLFASIAMIIISCNNNASNTTISTPDVPLRDSNPSLIVGKWKWAGSANDENKNEMPDKNEISYNNPVEEKELAAINISIDDLSVTINADGTGYTGKKANDSTKFTWAVKGKTNHFTTQNVADKSTGEVYINESGYLIQKESGFMKAGGQKVQQTTFELFKKEN